MTKKFVYAFAGKKADGKANMKNLLGGKGANLAEMASLGIDVPPGFTVSTEACVYYFKNKITYSSYGGRRKGMGNNLKQLGIHRRWICNGI